MFIEHEEFEWEKFKRKYGRNNGYTGEACTNCGRVRVEHYSKGFDICEKCNWCVQENDYCTNRIE